ncbi:family 4 glycosyl hydrolase [Microbacterium murale]|uniref:Alpha-glucosidase/alpha-galactosidase n=1 Tax=Microbacterium murale TaxID=1081040 RepID=A0ABQ1RHB6_9MICO|nr:alpha-galactosidase [Microbacterium murale]GGD68453.1 alpha-glucosidase/alpha-galactosidase [Microbacterium murale]
MKVTLIGAGSREFAGKIVRDLLLSEPIAQKDLEIVLMDIAAEPLAEMEAYTRHLIERLRHSATVSSTTDLDASVTDAAFVVTAIEVNRYHYWSQDFTVPRKHGFKQVYGENGGPGGMFHALRQFGPLLQIARAIEKHAPDALFLNFSNPEHKVCEAISRLTSVKVVGLCHGYFYGVRQISAFLDMPRERLDLPAAGINHFTWFQAVRDRETGEDLYPRLREIEREANWVSDWHEIGLSRILFRRFGLWPSPSANHIGEYISWAEDYVPAQLQYFHDPADGSPWRPGVPTPEWYYEIRFADTDRPFHAPRPDASLERSLEDTPIESSEELAIPIIEWVACGVERDLPAVNIPNRGAIPGLPDEMVVEVPARVENGELVPIQMEPLPEGILAMIQLHGSIHKLLVEAYAEQSKQKLLQAILLDPVVDSHNRAVAMLDEFLELQADALPPLT